MLVKTFQKGRLKIKSYSLQEYDPLNKPLINLHMIIWILYRKVSVTIALHVAEILLFLLRIPVHVSTYSNVVIYHACAQCCSRAFTCIFVDCFSQICASSCACVCNMMGLRFLTRCFVRCFLSTHITCTRGGNPSDNVLEYTVHFTGHEKQEKYFFNIILFRN